MRIILDEQNFQSYLQSKIENILGVTHVEGKCTDEVFDLLRLFKAQMIAHTDMVIGKDERPATETSPLMKQIAVNYKRIDWRNNLRDEQRQRNK